MQILRWIFKLAKEEDGSSESWSNSHDDDSTLITNPKRYMKKTSEASKHEQRKSFKRGIWKFCKRDVKKACFYDTLSLRRLSLSSSDSRRRKWEELFRSIAKMKQQAKEEEEEKEKFSRRLDSNNIKVLSVTEETNLNLEDNTNEKTKKEKKKAKATVSRMKDLMKWDASAKSDKAVKFIFPMILESGKRLNLQKIKMIKNDSRIIKSESSKMNLRWESENCSTTLSSIYTEVSVISSPRVSLSMGSHFNYRRGNWITNDSDFVVLEL